MLDFNKGKIYFLTILILLTLINFYLFLLIKNNYTNKNFFSDKRELDIAGNYKNRDTLILRDNSFSKKNLAPLEIGFSKYGTGLFTDEMFEFWTGGSVSFANHKRTPNIEIRNKTDSKAGIWLNGNGEIGSQLESIKFFLGDYNGDESNGDESQKIHTDKDYQLILKDDGLHIYGDLFINEISLKKFLENQN